MYDREQVNGAWMGFCVFMDVLLLSLIILVSVIPSEPPKAQVRYREFSREMPREFFKTEEAWRENNRGLKMKLESGQIPRWAEVK